MYVALKHIGGRYTPGEILPDNLPDDTLKWLLEAGAIREIAPASGLEPPKAQTPPGADEQTEPKREAEDGKTEPEDEAEDATGDEAEDEPEPLTIDPMEAVIPAKNAEATKTTGKTGGRRKTK